MRYFISLTILLSIAILTTACSTSYSKGPLAAGQSPMSLEELIAAAKDSTEKALLTTNHDTKQNWSLHGISVAEQCMMREPEEAACYYYRAINTGIYHEVKIVGYQKGVKQMIDDCEKVIKFDPKYDHGGAYRILGQIYTKLPQSVGRADSIPRDLDKAEEYLKQALRIDPNYPENQIFYAETMIEKEKFREALEALSTAKKVSPVWKKDSAYNTWQLSMEELKKRINKSNK